MRVLIISGSRADFGGLEAVASALRNRNVMVDLVESWVHQNYQLGSCIQPKTDLVVLLGDRSEILETAVHIYLRGLPIAHLSGGDITEGSKDDCMRHAITKLSHLHFVTNEESKRRVIQLGEEPWRVHNVGYPGIDNIELGLLSFEDAKRKAGILSYPNDFLLVVWHPNTFACDETTHQEINIITRALDKVFKKTLIIGPNADAGNEVVRAHFKKWAKETCNTYVDQLPRPVYLSLLKHCRCLIGNSSSGYYEAPHFGTTVLDIGDRQKGREKPKCLTNVRVDLHEIANYLHPANTINSGIKIKKCPQKIYGDGTAADKIADIICKTELTELLRKKWHDIL